MYKLLYNQTKKLLRKELEPAKLAKENYEDTCEIIRLVEESIELPQDFVPPIRVRFIRNNPNPAYRVTILGSSKEKRRLKQKDGRNVMVFSGKYVYKQFWVDKAKDGLVFTPELPERIA